MKIFKKPLRYTLARKKDIPDGLWSKCQKCNHLIVTKILAENLKVCPKCGYHFSLTCWERIDLLVDKNSFSELSSNLVSGDPLNFTKPKSYKDKIQDEQKITGLKDAVVIGEAKIDGYAVSLGITDQRFIMGSMGSVVGEKIARIIENGLVKKTPVIIVSGSGGGARMYEGLFSLMQMAKTCGALEKLKEKNVPFISVLTHPTMAGVLASFAGVGDITVAEPGALIGFTGPRVIKQTIKQDLPKGFQTSEFNLEHGMIDMIVHRKELRTCLAKLLYYVNPA